MKKKLIFYKLRAHVPEGAANVSGVTAVQEKVDVIKAFAAGRVNPLYCHALSISGWQLPAMYGDEYEVEFLGDGWTEVELAQGRGRIRQRSTG